MKHDLFSKCMRVVIAGITLIGIICCVFVIPELSRTFVDWYPEMEHWVLPWQILIYLCTVPCFVAMVISWKIAVNIGKDKSFTMENSRLFKIYSILALVDSAVFLIGSIVYWLIGINHPGLLLIDFLIVFAGIAVFVCTAALSYFVAKAASLQEDSDLTI